MHGFANQDFWTHRYRAGAGLILLACEFFFPSLVYPQFPEVKLTAREIHYGETELHGVSVKLGEEGTTLEIATVRFGEDPGFDVSSVNIRCASIDFASGSACAGERWALIVSPSEDASVPLEGTIAKILVPENGWSLESSLEAGTFRAALTAGSVDGNLDATLRWDGQALPALRGLPFMPEQIEWARSGAVSGEANLRWPTGQIPSVAYQADLKDLAFDSPDGRFAGEGLATGFSGTAWLDQNLRVDLKAGISAGALLVDNFYAAFDGQPLSLSGKAEVLDEAVRFTQLHVTDGESLEVLADANFRLDGSAGALDYRVQKLELHFPLAYHRYLEPVLAPYTLDGLSVTGTLEWNGGSEGGVLSPGVFELKDLTLVDGKRSRFAFTGLEAHVVTGQKNEESQFSWKGLLVQRINLGPGAAQVQAGGGRFSLTSPLRLGVLGGEVAVETLEVNMPGSTPEASKEPEIRLQTSIENLDMKELTTALEWPAFEGKISGSIPGVAMRDGVLEVEGQIAFDVFDGQILLSGLRVERPFGVLPSLAANLDVHNLDLQQVTHTFSFGQISGRMEGFVHELRMLDWKPVAFDAWFGTPAGEKTQNISRQAVNRLTSIGGGGATAALTGPVLKLFSNFSYRRLGLGCRLQNNTCEVRGLDDDAASVLIMEGAGVPKIMIRAFNRQMDFPTLISGLTAAAEGESMRVEH